MPTNEQCYDQWFTDYTSASREEQQRRLAKVTRLEFFRDMQKSIGHLTSVTILTPKEK